MSSACATGCPWKLPPEMTSPSGKTSGLSVEAFSSTSTVSAANRMASRDGTEDLGCAAETVGILHLWVPFPVRSRISLSASRRRIRSAASICPGWGRAS